MKHNEHNAELEHPPEEQSTPERRHPYGIGMVIYDQLAGGREIFLASAMPTVRFEKKKYCKHQAKKAPLDGFYYLHSSELLVKTEFRALTDLCY